jgi:hypothetical protein
VGHFRGLNLLNEMLIKVIYCHLFLFPDFVPKAKDRDLIGMSVTSIIIGLVFINVGKLVYEILRDIIKSILTCRT